jgi:hypothetical protein
VDGQTVGGHNVLSLRGLDAELPDPGLLLATLVLAACSDNSSPTPSPASDCTQFVISGQVND